MACKSATKILVCRYLFDSRAVERFWNCAEKKNEIVKSQSTQVDGSWRFAQSRIKIDTNA
jgi:hypothetical protein